MSKENKLIPELRFPEFVKDGEWRVQELNNHIDFQTGYPFKSSNFNETGKGIRLVKNRDLKSDNGIVFYDGEYSKEYIVNNGDILVGMDGDFTPRCWNKGTALLNQRVGRVKAKDKQSERFFEYFLSIQLQEIEKNTARTTVKHLTHSVVENIIAPLPHPQEQQKIASCLSSLDELITAHNDKLQALKDHKKGLMQNLFPQPSAVSESGTVAELVEAKVPKFRFPEFEGDGEWVEKKLEDVATFLKGKGISKSEVVENGKTPCIRYGELYTLYNETISFIHSYTYLNPKNLVLSEANDVIIPASGETQIDIATASCVLEDGIALGGDLNIIKTKINGVFLSYYLNNAKKMDIARIAQGISVVHLYANQLKTLALNIPNPKEQQKIASFLSTLDELIAAQEEKIEQLQQHKKGLMQGLFPKIKN